MKRKVVYRSPPYMVEGYIARTVKFVDGSTTTKLEHREVMEAKLKRELHPTEIVHHKDHNKLNNDLTNLVLTNNVEHGKLHAKVVAPEQYVCIGCSAKFFRLSRWVRHNQGALKRPGPFCSRSCAGRFNAAKRVY